MCYWKTELRESYKFYSSWCAHNSVMMTLTHRFFPCQTRLKKFSLQKCMVRRPIKLHRILRMHDQGGLVNCSEYFMWILETTACSGGLENSRELYMLIWEINECSSWHREIRLEKPKTWKLVSEHINHWAGNTYKIYDPESSALSGLPTNLGSPAMHLFYSGIL